MKSICSNLLAITKRMLRVSYFSDSNGMVLTARNKKGMNYMKHLSSSLISLRGVIEHGAFFHFVEIKTQEILQSCCIRYLVIIQKNTMKSTIRV